MMRTIADAELIRSEPHPQLGAVLQNDADAILALWCRRARLEQPNAQRVHFDTLRDHLPELLRAIAGSLTASANGDTHRHAPPAAEHGAQRWQAGWSLPEVVRDYQILRLVLVEHLHERLQRPLTLREGLAIGLVLDEAITASITQYTHHADDEQRRRQAQREEQLRLHAAALSEADRHKNEFLAVLGHELRNPLAPLRNAVHLLRRRGDAATVAWACDLYERQVGNLTRLADDLLDLTHLARGKLALRRQALDLTALARTAVEDHRPVFAGAGRTLEFEEVGAPLWVRGDPVRLTQVLANLLSNALRYTDADGAVKVRVAADGDLAVLEVQDDGVGIAPEFLPHVFHRYAQGESDPKREKGGLGLGLALVRGLVELHGGKVEAASAGPGQGATFTVRLPLDAPAQPAAPAPPEVPALKVLIIEDNRDAADSLAVLLRLFGHSVRVAYNGPDGVERVREEQPDVVLCDLGLPGKDGLAVARELRQGVFAEGMLIALSGHGTEMHRQRCQDAGFTCHLIKPVDTDELRGLLEEVAQARKG